MIRLPDWHERYVNFINDMRRVPFEWGTADCGPAWAGRVVNVLTGEPNPLAEYEGRYKSMRGAVRVMRNSGFDDLKALVAAKLGEAVHPSQGYIGDIGVITDDSPFRYSLGIVNGDRVFFRTLEGIGTVDLLEIDSVFKI